ncbi:MAG TPA: sigma-70 factor domain-containing protein, partial [Isosphaeraceae bacterium]|nr:sigma-70 factor domain-containing protein [Isosphaeraceae bacterium]
MARIRRHRRDTVQSPLEIYLREINEVALLTADEEKMLAHRIAKGDDSARERM